MTKEKIFGETGSLKERVVTALILAFVVVCVGVINSFTLTWILLGVVYIVAFNEACKLFEIENSSLYLYALFLWIGAYFYPYGDDLFILVGVVFASVVAYKQETPIRHILPFIYPTAGVMFLLSLYVGYGMYTLFWMMLVVAFTDIGAYFVGKKFGKTPFSPTSPKKTLEGVFGGVFLATLLGAMLGSSIVDTEKAMLVSFLVSLSSVYGDLFESYLKRKAGVKDSGDFLPGHGGMLDRIDGYLFASIVMLISLRALV
ncbi:MAG: phosphatidate cytidylyltransferase [Campylobacterota bacterium]|nr:phosphatidate cytidylyltransferase [Campylobacterota bacterium]